MKKTTVIGIALIIIGLLSILKTYFGLSLNINWSHVWPFILIVLGIHFISKK